MSYKRNRLSAQVGSDLQILLDPPVTGSSAVNGIWRENDLTKKSSLHVFTTGTVTSFSLTLQGSNAEKQPDAGTDGVAIGSAITAAGLVEVSVPCRWIRAKLTAISATGTVSAHLHQII